MIRLRQDDHEAEVEKFENLQICDYSQIAEMIILAIQSEVYEEEKDDWEEDSVLDEDENMEELVFYHDEDKTRMEYFLCDSNPSTEYEGSTKCLPACSFDSQSEQLYVDDSSPSIYTSSKSEVTAAEDKDNLDAFYYKYTERMRWFDMLNYDRTCGTSGSLLIITLCYIDSITTSYFRVLQNECSPSCPLLNNRS